jgi:hypothetical protein
VHEVVGGGVADVEPDRAVESDNFDEIICPECSPFFFGRLGMENARREKKEDKEKVKKVAE